MVNLGKARTTSSSIGIEFTRDHQYNCLLPHLMDSSKTSPCPPSAFLGSQMGKKRDEGVMTQKEGMESCCPESSSHSLSATGKMIRELIEVEWQAGSELEDRCGVKGTPCQFTSLP